MIELRSSVSKKKPIIALTENDSTRGGLSMDEVRTQLHEVDANYVKWGFDDDSTGSAGGEALYAALFHDEPVEWNRIGAFQE